MIESEDILVTGAKGFIGRHLVERLKAEQSNTIHGFGRQTDRVEIVSAIRKCKKIYHCAAEIRTSSESSFFENNVTFTNDLCAALDNCDTKPEVFFFQQHNLQTAGATA